jgi:hypothetical protein
MTKRKLTKSALARKLLERGYSITETAKTVGMLYGHAWAVHREMQLKGQPVERKIGSAPMYGVSESELASDPNYRNLAASEDDNVVRPRVVGPHKVMRVTKAEAEALKVEAYAQATRGQPEDNTVEQVLEERGNDYGDYASKAQFIQGVKYLMRTSPSWEAMDADMRESMEMIAHKMGRVVYGNPTHKDNFLDIAGYAKLVADRL